MGSRMLVLNWVISGSTGGRCSETIHLLSGLMEEIQYMMVVSGILLRVMFPI